MQPGYKFLETERSRYYGYRVFLIDRYLSFVNTINSSATPSIDRIDALIDSLHPFVLNDLDQIDPHMKQHRYRPLIFLCVDKDLEDVAVHLIKRGATYKVNDSKVSLLQGQRPQGQSYVSVVPYNVVWTLSAKHKILVARNLLFFGCSARPRFGSHICIDQVNILQ